jgi:hypothetical protein
MLKALLPALCAALATFQVDAQDASALRARHAALTEQLANSGFGRPVHVESSIAGSAHKGEIFAVIERPFSVVAPALARPAQWCEVVTLQVNIKRCEASDQAMRTAITRRAHDSVDSAHPVDFRFQRAAASADYVHVLLDAPSGPVGTRDYAIRLEAAPLDARRTFVHMSYAYTLGTMARFAMDAYLAGAGRDKVGFSVVERTADGQPVYVDGMRGVVERTAMRYFLAAEAYLDSLGEPADKRLDARLRRWYAAITRYPQLRERLGPDEYVEMKRREATAAG